MVLADADQLPACLGHSQQRPGARALAQVSQLTLQRSPLPSASAGGAELRRDVAGGCWWAALAPPASLAVLYSHQGYQLLHDPARAKAGCSEQPFVSPQSHLAIFNRPCGTSKLPSYMTVHDNTHESPVQACLLPIIWGVSGALVPAYAKAHPGLAMNLLLAWCQDHSGCSSNLATLRAF